MPFLKGLSLRTPQASRRRRYRYRSSHELGTVLSQQRSWEDFLCVNRFYSDCFTSYSHLLQHIPNIILCTSSRLRANTNPDQMASHQSLHSTDFRLYPRANLWFATSSIFTLLELLRWKSAPLCWPLHSRALCLGWPQSRNLQLLWTIEHLSLQREWNTTCDGVTHDTF